jgi:hypothetical protein
MPPRWNSWAGIQSVQFDWEKEPRERQVRLSAPTARVGDPVRIRMSGVEIEGIIADARGPVLKVKVKATPLKVKAVKSKRSRSA